MKHTASSSAGHWAGRIIGWVRGKHQEGHPSLSTTPSYRLQLSVLAARMNRKEATPAPNPGSARCLTLWTLAAALHRLQPKLYAKAGNLQKAHIQLRHGVLAAGGAAAQGARGLRVRHSRGARVAPVVPVGIGRAAAAAGGAAGGVALRSGHRGDRRGRWRRVRPALHLRAAEAEEKRTRAGSL